MPADELFDQLGFGGGGGTATAGRQSPGYRVLQPGAGAGARARSSAPMQQGGARIEPLTTARYPMKSGPAPRTAPAPRAMPQAAPPAPRYDPATYDGPAEYAKLRGRMGLPAETAPPPMPVHQAGPATGMAETFMQPAQQQAGLVAEARLAQGAGRFPRLTNAMSRVGQYGLEGGLMPRMGTPAQAAGAAGMGLAAGAVNNPEAALQAATNPISTGAGMAQSGYNAVVNPYQSWGPDFTTGMTRLLSGEVGAGELAGAVGDATMVRPVFNAGMKMGNTLNTAITNPGQFAGQFGRGLGRIGNAMMGY